MMKKIIGFLTLLILVLTALQSKAQQINTITICNGASQTLTAVNNFNLSNLTYSIQPGGTTSPSPVFTVSPSVQTTYSLYTTGTNSNGIATTTYNMVWVDFMSPIFSLPTLAITGCNTQSSVIVNIINPNTYPLSGAPMTFSFFAPGNPTSNPVAAVNSSSWTTVSTTGTWSVAVLDNNNGCATWSTFPVVQNTIAPGISVSAPTRTLTCNTTSLMLVGNSPTNAIGPVNYEWILSSIPNPTPILSPTLIVTNNNSPTTNSVNSIYVLTVTDLGNGCSTSSIVTILQNIAPPFAKINGAPYDGSCSNGIQVLINGSYLTSTGFLTPLGTSAILWEGPSPQIPATNTSSYLAQVSGIYSMTVRDLNNSCVSTTIVTLDFVPSAAFVQTVTGGQVTFSNTSINTGTNPSYYWDFGDGYTSLDENPTHNYLSGGSHLVTFVTSNPGLFCSDTVIQSVNVSGLPCYSNSSFSVSPTNTPQEWVAVPNYPWNVTSAVWDWGDGSSSNTLYSSHQYATAGQYNICLSATVSCAASSSNCLSYNEYKGASQQDVIRVNIKAPDLISGFSSIADDGDMSWNILPNPNEGEFNLKFRTRNTKPTHIVISDLMGRLVHDETVIPSSEIVPVKATELPQGMYLITLQSGDLKVTKRLVVNR